MDPTAPSLPHDDVHLLLTGMYDDYLGGDRAAIDARLAEDVTIFDSASDALVTGLEELAALRGRRTDAAAEPSAPAWTENALTVPASSSFTAYRTGRVGCWARKEGDGVRAATPSRVSRPVPGSRRSSAMPSPSPPLSPV